MTRLSREACSVQELLNFRLGRLVALGGLPVVRMCEALYGIARREWGLVSVLGHAGEMSPSALATELGLDRARTSRVLQQLVRKGLVERRELQGDRRQARVALTPAGRALYSALLPRVAEVNRALLSVLDDDEVALLDGIVGRLSAQAALLARESDGLRARRYLGSSSRTTPPPAT